ncbi:MULTISPECIES: hypothetical protein [unclassified Pseudactinotalea]|uniref:hypothetical protein n=1 Tax=Micrococcales TaxID=85006 RepID=UPI003C7AB560
MRTVRSIGNAALAVWLALALTVARIAPIALMFALVAVPYRVAGTLVVIVGVVLVVHTVSAARAAVLDRGDHQALPDDDYVVQVAEEARAQGLPVPTVLHLEGRSDRAQDPVTIRGWRWCFVLTPAGVDPRDLVHQVGPDLRDGTARIRVLLWAFDLAVTDWRVVLRMMATPFRKGVRTDLRLYLFPLLLLSPLALTGYLIARVLGAVTGMLLPRRFRRAMPAPVSAGVRAEPGSHDPALPEVGPSTPNWRRVPDLRPIESLLGPSARVIIALLVTLPGTYQGLGVLPAERTAWAWEEGPAWAEVVDVVHTERSDGLLEQLGIRHNSTWRPQVALPDASHVWLAEGTTPVEPGESIQVMSWTAVDGEHHRHPRQTSWTRYIVMSLLMLGASVGLSLPFATSFPTLLGLAGNIRLRRLDHDQRVLTGRRHRRRRPWSRLGKRFADLL